MFFLFFMSFFISFNTLAIEEDNNKLGDGTSCLSPSTEKRICSPRKRTYSREDLIRIKAEMGPEDNSSPLSPEDITRIINVFQPISPKK